MNPLLADARDWKLLLTELRDAYPELADDDFLDTLDGELPLKDRIEHVVTSALDDEAMAESLKAQMADMAARKKRFETRAERKRTMVCDAMGESGLKKLEFPRFTISWSMRKGAIVVDNSDALPVYCRRVKIEPDKTAIKAEFDKGLEVPGAHLANDHPSITVRSR